MKRRNIVAPFIFMLLAACVFSYPSGVKAETYRVGILDFPPYSVIETSGKYKGILVELMEKVLKKARISYTVTSLPQKRLFNDLATGDMHIYMGIKGVPAYEGKVLFSKFPVSDIDLRVYARKGTALIHNKEQLKGKRVIVILGYGYGGLIRFLKDPANHIALDPTATHMLALRKLRAKRADYVLDYRRPAGLAITEEGMADEVISHSLAKLNIYFIVSKKAPNAPKLMKQMEEAYQDLKAEGKM